MAPPAPDAVFARRSVSGPALLCRVFHLGAVMGIGLTKFIKSIRFADNKGVKSILHVRCIKEI
jgi:hypothetical protein